MRAGAVHAAVPADPALARARELIMEYGWNAMAYQLLNPRIELWFNAARDAVVGYVCAGGYRVVAGSPVCAPEQLGMIAEEFSAEARRAGQRVCYFGAQQRLTDALATQGVVTELLLGAQPAWDPHVWPEVVAGKASLRAQFTRARNKGVVVEPWDTTRATNDADLARCLREWLATRGLPPMHFLVEPDTLARIYDRRVFVARRAERVVGFLLASPVPLRNGWLIEQIIRGSGAPNGTAELMLDAAMRALAAEGAEYITLGLSPLSRAAQLFQPGQSLPVLLALALIRAHGRRFYNFEGLDRFKAKFQPQRWEPIYAVTNERRTSLRTLYAIAGAFGGTSPVLFVSRAVIRAGWQELLWARQRLMRRH